MSYRGNKETKREEENSDHAEINRPTAVASAGSEYLIFRW